MNGVWTADYSESGELKAFADLVAKVCVESRIRRFIRLSFQPGFQGVLRDFNLLRKVGTMAVITRMLARRVDELTKALAAVRAQAEEVKEAEDMAEVTDAVDEIIEYVNMVIGPEDNEADSGEEESIDESEEESGEDE